MVSCLASSAIAALCIAMETHSSAVTRSIGVAWAPKISSPSASKHRAPAESSRRPPEAWHSGPPDSLTRGRPRNPGCQSDSFVLMAQPFGEDPHHLQREHRHVLDQEEELLLLDRGHGDVGQGHDGGAARAVVDKGHFAENALRA